MSRKPWSDRLTVEECRSLNIAGLLNSRIILHGNCLGSFGSFHPVQWSSGFEVIVQYKQRSLGDGTLRLVRTIRGQRIEAQIEITSIPSPLRWERRRYYFKCPGLGDPCGRRVGKLYLPPGETRFACRICYNLTYRSSKEHNKRLDEFLRLPPEALARLLESPDWNTRFLALTAARRIPKKTRT